MFADPTNAFARFRQSTTLGKPALVGRNNETREENTDLSLPDSVKLTKLPEAVHFENAAGRYDASYTQQGQHVQIRRKLSTTLASPLVQGESYQQLRALTAEVGRDLRSTIAWK